MSIFGQKISETLSLDFVLRALAQFSRGPQAKYFSLINPQIIKVSVVCQTPSNTDTQISREIWGVSNEIPEAF